MNEVNFKLWLNDRGYSKKLQSDIVSRLKKIEREFGFIDIDDEYSNDKCEKLLSSFKNKGENEEMKRFNSLSLPIGKYQLSTYKYAVNLYLKFLINL
jgi:hypothetical protein